MDGTVLIDLGTIRHDQPEPEPPASRPGAPRFPRTGALALVGALVLAIGGGAPPPPPPIEAISTVQLTRDGAFYLTEEHLFVADWSGATELEVAAYELEHGRPLWTSRHSGGTAPQVSRRPPVGVTVGGRLSVRPATDGLLLVEYASGEFGASTHTLALALRPGRTRWPLPHPLRVLPADRTGLVVDEVFPEHSRIGPGARQAGRAAGSVRVSETGEVYLADPLGVVARAVDLADGRVLWTSPRLDSALLAAHPDDGTASVLVLVDGRVEWWDARTGQPRHRLDHPRGAVRSVALFGDSVLIQHAGPGLTAYSPDLRRERWTRPLANADSRMVRCGPMICVDNGTSSPVLDPATGAELWRLPDQDGLYTLGGHLVDFDSYPWIRRVIDPRTGNTLLDLTGWSDATRFAQHSLPLLLRRNSSGRTWLGLLDVPARQVRLLGSVPEAVANCQALPGMLTCRISQNEIRLWHYR